MRNTVHRRQVWRYFPLYALLTDAKAEAPILRPSDAKSQLIGKAPDAGEDWGQEEKKVTEDEMVRWHHCLSGHEFEQTMGDSEGQGSLAWGRKETRQQLNNKKCSFEYFPLYSKWIYYAFKSKHNFLSLREGNVLKTDILVNGSRISVVMIQFWKYHG